MFWAVMFGMGSGVLVSQVITLVLVSVSDGNCVGGGVRWWL